MTRKSCICGDTFYVIGGPDPWLAAHIWTFTHDCPFPQRGDTRRVWPYVKETR